MRGKAEKVEKDSIVWGEGANDVGDEEKCGMDVENDEIVESEVSDCERRALGRPFPKEDEPGLAEVSEKEACDDDAEERRTGSPLVLPELPLDGDTPGRAGNTPKPTGSGG